MPLISTARALNDERFLWRVRAAALALSVSKYDSQNANEKALAQYVLDNPMVAIPTLEALVANHGAVNAAVTVSSENTVSTEAVTDAMITTAVGIYWLPVANRRAERIANGPS